ncbi:MULTISPECIES: hypothetical protein [Arthrobacter]|uniref:ATP-dependent endonuclease n=2 Tax=Arthrobacter TaxID=1663 RepID=A0ABU9KHX8_9MICC|nr:hypothetical protein [Arthrobacter sp. YJM1]MDP5225978.1 hypothetical protein [Arthrobacter sp. YJM1]
MEHIARVELRGAAREVVVFLEGVSDVAAVTVLAERAGVDLARVELVSLDGVTNMRKALTECVLERPDAGTFGLCDGGEVRFVMKALHAVGHPVADVGELPEFGFFVCRADLEDELIRALGPDRVLGVIDRLGLRVKLDTLQQQPAWSSRPLAEQLHRFCGVASGRKELLARELARELAEDEVPEPLRMLVARLPR